MNKKGFTLVELLAVILILALLAIIASTSVTKVVDDSKNNLQTAQIKLIEDAAKTWGAENMSALPEGNSCIYLTLKDLKTYGLIDLDIRNPKTEKKLSNDIKIKITSKISNYNTEVLNYEVDPESVEGCIYYPRNICKLISGKTKTMGSKYECKVDPNRDPYTFYVLSEGENGTTNLILDRNVYYDEATNTRGLTDENHDGLVAWINEEDYESVSDNNWEDWEDTNNYGPITAMNYLNNATSTWTNLENLNITYNDDKGRFSNFKITGKARLPRLDEVNGSGCDVGEPLTCLLWMVEYLYDAEEDFGEDYQQNPLNNIYGYWIFSTGDFDYDAMYVSSNGSVSANDVENNNYYGVRPVINVRL